MLGGKQVALEEVKKENGACGGSSEGGFWAISRAFEAERSCSLSCLISLQKTESPLYSHKTAELINDGAM